MASPDSTTAKIRRREAAKAVGVHSVTATFESREVTGLTRTGEPIGTPPTSGSAS